MKCSNGLLFPISVLEKTSGISKKIISKDIENELLFETVNGYILYDVALRYVFQKWKEDNVKMYPPYSDEPYNSFASRVLSYINDEIVFDNLKVEWKENK